MFFLFGPGFSKFTLVVYNTEANKEAEETPLRKTHNKDKNRKQLRDAPPSPGPANLLILLMQSLFFVCFFGDQFIGKRKRSWKLIQ